MQEPKPQKYKTFKEFNDIGKQLVKFIIETSNGLSPVEQVNFARKNIDKNILNSYILINDLSIEIKNILGTKANSLKFSIDNLIKNRLIHPEVMDLDYDKIPQIIKNPSKYLKSSNGYDVILFKYIEKYYKLVIKTTKNKKENFIKSLHLLNKNRYDKY